MEKFLNSAFDIIQWNDRRWFLSAEDDWLFQVRLGVLFDSGKCVTRNGHSSSLVYLSGIDTEFRSVRATLELKGTTVKCSPTNVEKCIKAGGGVLVFPKMGQGSREFRRNPNW